MTTSPFIVSTAPAKTLSVQNASMVHYVENNNDDTTQSGQKVHGQAVPAEKVESLRQGVAKAIQEGRATNLDKRYDSYVPGQHTAPPDDGWTYSPVEKKPVTVVANQLTNTQGRGGSAALAAEMLRYLQMNMPQN